MYITVRSFDGKQQHQIQDISKLTKIEDVRLLISSLFSVEPPNQRLFFRGKEMVDGCSLFDYEVQLNDTLQLMIRKRPTVEKPPSEKTSPYKETSSTNLDIKNASNENLCIKDPDTQEPSSSSSCQQLFKVGDLVDVRDPVMGAWFEARVTNYTVDPSQTIRDDSLCANERVSSASHDDNLYKLKQVSHNDGFLYEILFEGGEQDTLNVTGIHIRPRAKTIVPVDQLTLGQQVMLNYNYDEPDNRGYWYDGIIESVDMPNSSRGRKSFNNCIVKATIFFGESLIPLKHCRVKWINEIMLPGELGTQKNVNNGDTLGGALRERKAECDHCNDNPRRNCKECSCRVCGKKENYAQLLLCDECNNGYHMACLKPPLTVLPPEEEDWYCPNCKNDVNQVVASGQAPKESKKRASMPSSKSNAKRDWGRGFACAGLNKVCTIVPSDHFGPIPGVEVGQMWLMRIQVGESGVHRPPVSGIHGRENHGAYSIVLSGGYEDDHDDGDQFYYTGSGGRDLTGNRRTAGQSCDQLLTKCNLALARNCYAKIDSKNGADAADQWKLGKPVRVVRNYKAHKHAPKYAPEKGNRYDGIYKVVKYWPDTGKSGFLIWRYLLRRDDPAPAPWTKKGKQRIEELGLEMEYPEGYQEKSIVDSGSKKSVKRKKEESENDAKENSPPAKKRLKGYSIPDENLTLINADTKNKSLWQEVHHLVKKGTTRKEVFSCIERVFCCLCCQELLVKPVTTDCFHNVCLSCLTRSFNAGVKSCPYCRKDISYLRESGKKLESEVNDELQAALCSFFPGYLRSK